MTAHGSMHVLLAPIAICYHPACGKESIIICRLCTRGTCGEHQRKCPGCDDYFCRSCAPVHIHKAHIETSPPASLAPSREPPAGEGGTGSAGENSRICDVDPVSILGRAKVEESALYLIVEPPIWFPRDGQVEISVHGETAIVRVLDRTGELVESRPNCAVRREGEEIRVIWPQHHA